MSKIKIQENIELDNGSKAIKVNSSGVGATVGSNAYIQLLTGSITLTGTMDEDETPRAVGAIKMADYSGTDSLSTAGIYIVPIDGLETLTLSGTATAIVKVIQD